MRRGGRVFSGSYAGARFELSQQSRKRGVEYEKAVQPSLERRFLREAFRTVNFMCVKFRIIFKVAAFCPLH